LVDAICTKMIKRLVKISLVMLLSVVYCGDILCLNSLLRDCLVFIRQLVRWHMQK